MTKYTQVRSCDDCDMFVPFRDLVERKLSETESEYVCKDKAGCAEAQRPR
ncbi:hypothetical protein LCGC14_1486580 [marine sediment metagenome]|uniref:Uncharacterized protein n=1 Tax=marine sediment metagenome TaxID=412755 RepID=A0A0F9J8P6_9ZZZZ